MESSTSGAVRFFGKYRAVVVDNQDPDTLGRVKARVPAVLGDVESGWALPCTPYTGDKVGFYMIPAPGAHIWVEFEGGDPSRPIWVGGYWHSGEMIENVTPDVKVIRTETGHRLTMDDAGEKVELLHSGGALIVIDGSSVKVEHSGGAKLVIDDSTIVIDNNGPQITLDGSSITIENGGQRIVISTSSVSVNNGALEVR